MYDSKGKVCVKRRTESLVCGPKPPFKIPDVRHVGEAGERITHEVSDGWLIAHYAGEWGGSLYWHSKGGKRSYYISSDLVRCFVSTPHGLYMAQGLAHLGGNSGSIKRIARSAKTGKWEVKLFAELPGAPDCAISDDRGGILVAAGDLVRVDGKKQVRAVVKGTGWGGLYPNSMVLTREGTLYVGMRQGVAKIESLFTKPRYTWLVPSKKLLRDEYK